MTLLAARLQVKAHGKRRFVIALKYDGETDYRFLVASDLSWRHQDIAAVHVEMAGGGFHRGLEAACRLEPVD